MAIIMMCCHRNCAAAADDDDGDSNSLSQLELSLTKHFLFFIPAVSLSLSVLPLFF